jgi:glycosyltransferase involved in cell wall biosynthesis
LLPYRDISQSGALMTVMTEHIPVLATNVGGLAEPLAVAPIGWVISHPTPENLKQALLDLLDHPEKIKAVKDDSNSWNTVCQHYGWEHIGKQTQQLYESL